MENQELENQERRLQEQQLQKERTQEQQLQDEQIREEQQRQDQQIREQQTQEQQRQDQQIRDQQIRDQQIQDQQIQDQQIRYQQIRNQQIRDQQLRVTDSTTQSGGGNAEAFDSNMRYLNEVQEHRLNEMLQRYADNQESITVKSGRTIIYRGSPGEPPEIDRITPKQLDNLDKAINNPEQSTGSIKISKEQSYQVQAGQAAENNSLRPVERTQKEPSQSPEMAQLLSQVAELKQHSVAQNDKMAAWQRELSEMRETIARQEKLLKQATTPVHEKLGNWFDGQKERIGNWFDQQKERLGNRIDDFKSSIQEIRDNIQSKFSEAKQQIRNNIDSVTGVAGLREEVKRLEEQLRFQDVQQQKLSEELRLNRQVTEVEQPSVGVESQQVQAVPVAPINNEYLDKSREIQNKEISQLTDSQKANFNRLATQLEREKLVEFRAGLIEKKQFDAGTSLVPQYLEFKQGQERERLATELADRQKYSRPPVLELTLGGSNSGPDPWHYLAKAPEDLQISSGIIPPINITPAGAQWYSEFVADGKRLKAEEMVRTEKERLKEAGYSPEQIQNGERYIREEVFGRVGEEWKQERAEALKKWQESKAVNSFQTFVQNQPTLTQSQSEPQKISSPENQTKLESERQATSLASDKPYGPVLVLNNNGNVRWKHQEPKHTPEVRANDSKFEEKNQSTAPPQIGTENRSSDSQITTRQLESWLDNAKELGKTEEYQDRIKKVIESHNQGKPVSEAAVQAMEKDTQQFLATYSEIENRHATEPRQASGIAPESNQKQQTLQQPAEIQATKNAPSPQQLQEIAQSSPNKHQPQQHQISEQQQPLRELQDGNGFGQNGAAQNGATPQRTNKTGIEKQGQEKVNVSDLKQWRKEAEALDIHGPVYLNKIDKLTELAEQKVGSNGRVSLKEPDSKRMQADRQEFKQLGREQAQTQSKGMRM